MPRTSIPRTLTELETLAQSITPEVRADLPQIERALVKLQNLLAETKKLLAKRDDYQARKQEATHRRRLAVVLLVALAAAAPLRATGPARLVLDPDPGTRLVAQGASDFTQLGDRAVFVRIDPGLGRALWVTDGTPAGTVQLGLLCPPCGFTTLLGSTGRVAFYRVGDGFNSYPSRWRLWRTDGTAAGTFALTSELRFPWGLPIPLDLPFLAALEGDRLYFTGCLPTTGCELWSSDGTIPGTGPLAEIAPGPPSAKVVELTAASDDRLYFTAQDVKHGREPWRLHAAGVP